MTNCGVYPGMFEQSILLESPAEKKTGAIFPSFSAQIAVAGVLILIPLIYTDVLPGVQLPSPLAFSLSQPPEPPPAKPATRSAKPSVPLRAFVVPITIPPHALRQPTAPVENAPPPGPLPFGNPSAIGTLFDASSASLPQVEKPPQSLAPAAAPLKSPPALLTVGGDVLAAKLIKKVVPKYPPLARQIRVSGTVRLIGVVGKDGTLQQLRVVSGHPLLIQAALEAVRQWVYRPTILDGRPVEVTAPIDVIFTLSQ